MNTLVAGQLAQTIAIGGELTSQQTGFAEQGFQTLLPVVGARPQTLKDPGDFGADTGFPARHKRLV